MNSHGIFSPRTVLWMVLVGVVSFCAFFALAAYAPDLRAGSDGRGHALSKSAIGFAGAVELLRGAGRPVEVRRGPAPRAGRSPGVMLLTPEPRTEPKDIKQVRFAGPRLVVLPKWTVEGQPLHQGWVDKTGLIEPDSVVKLLGPVSNSVRVERRKGSSHPALAGRDSALFQGARLPLGEIESLQTIAGDNLAPVLVDEQGRTVLAAVRNEAIYVLADPDLLNNHGLAGLTAARAAAAILDELRGGEGPVVFDVTLNGFTRGRSVLRLALEPPLLGATICLLLAAGLMGLHAAGRFGPPAVSERTIALGKTALAENSAALVRMAKREPRMAEPYAALAREAAAKAVGAPRDLSVGQLDALLDRLGVARGAGATFSALMAEAQSARTNHDLTAVARRLYHWKAEMTRDAR